MALTRHGLRQRDVKLGVESEDAWGRGTSQRGGKRAIRAALPWRELGASGTGCYGFAVMSPISVRMASSILRIRASSTVLEYMMYLTLP